MNKQLPFKIKMLKRVSGFDGRTFEVGEIYTVTIVDPLRVINVKSPTFNGMTVEIEGYPRRKFFWHDEIEVL